MKLLHVFKALLAAFMIGIGVTMKALLIGMISAVDALLESSAMRAIMATSTVIALPISLQYLSRGY